MNTKNTGFQYDKDITTGQSVIYAFQNLIIFMASAVVMPIVVGYAVGLSQAEVAQMLQRTFFLCGIMTLLQVKWGHGFPIQEGPAGLWSGIFLSLAVHQEENLPFYEEIWNVHCSSAVSMSCCWYVRD